MNLGAVARIATSSGGRHPPLGAMAKDDDGTRALGDCGLHCALAARGSGHPPRTFTHRHPSWWDLASLSLVRSP